MSASPDRARAFLPIVIGQAASMIGSRTARFAVGTWAYQQSGEVTDFAWVALAEAVPFLLLGPFAGAVADRFPRRRIIILAEVIAALAIALVIAAIWRGAVPMALVFGGVLVSAVASAFRYPALMAAVAQLVPPAQLGRANGLLSLGDGCAQLLAPVTGAALLGLGGLSLVLALDLLTFGIALAPLLFTSIPPLPTTPKAARTSLWSDVRVGAAYIGGRPSLLALTWFFIASCVLHSMLDILVPPFLLSLTTTEEMGVALSIAGAGAVAGAGLAALWGGGARLLPVLIAAGVVFGVAIVWGASHASVVMVAGAGAVALCCGALLMSTNNALLHKLVPQALHGRAFAVRGVAGEAAGVLALALTGPLVDRVITPALAATGTFTVVAERLIPLPGGRPLALALWIGGALFVAAHVLPLCWRNVRHMERGPTGVTRGAHEGARDMSLNATDAHTRLS